MTNISLTAAPPPAIRPSSRSRARRLLCEFLPINGLTRQRPLSPLLPRFQRLPAVPQSVGRARRIVHDMLDNAGEADAALADTAALLTSELVTNAITHGPSGNDCFIELTVWLADRHWWVAVADAGELLPAPRNPTDDGEGGRGLLLIANLAATWGLLPRPTVGKAVYFALARPPA
jgi:anti-sigma regulatory factor (Ser/Thr protein kinase)